MELNEVDIEDIGFIDENNIFNPTVVETLLPSSSSSSRNGIIKTLKPISTKPPIVPPKKNKISYDDLLSNMGMSLINGKLELYNKSKLAPSYEQPNDPRYQNVNDYRYQQNISQSNNPNYNRGNVVQQQQQQPQQQPMTKQQYKKYLALEYLKQQQQRNRIGQIKSKKLLFSNPESAFNIRPLNTNRFFSFVTR